MDLDNLVTLIMLFLFFVLPSIMKRKVKKQKNKTGAAAPKISKKKKKGFSIFGKVNDAIREFVRELEKQALEAKKRQAEQQEPLTRDGQTKQAEPVQTRPSSGTVWDDLDDRKKELQEDWAFTLEEDLSTEDDAVLPEPVQKKTPVSRFHDPDHPFLRPEKTPGRRTKQAHETPAPVQGSPESEFPRVHAGLPAHSLQKAVIWSEILGKPVSLRDY